MGKQQELLKPVEMQKDTEIQISANLLNGQGMMLWGTTPGCCLGGEGLTVRQLKTAANRFQNILHLFIAKRADHEVCGEGNTTLRKNYSLREAKAVKIEK